MAEIDAFFKTMPEAKRAREQIREGLPVEVSPPYLVEEPRNGRAWEISISPTSSSSGPAAETRFFNAVLAIVNRFDGEVHTGPVSGSPYQNRLVSDLPQSVIDRYRDEHPGD